MIAAESSQACSCICGSRWAALARRATDWPVAAGDLVGQQHLQEVVVWQPVGPSQGEPFGQGVEQPH